jgi:hypothetical protein
LNAKTKRIYHHYKDHGNLKFFHIAFPLKTFLSNNKLTNNALKLFKYFNIVFKMSSLPKIYLHKPQCFQEFYCSKLKLLISRIDDLVDLKSKENRGHLKIELNLIKANTQITKYKQEPKKKKHLMYIISIRKNISSLNIID